MVQLLAEIKSLASGYVFGEPDAWKFSITDSYLALHRQASLMMVVLAALLALLTTLLTRTRVQHAFRARQATEKIVMALMTICSVVAILTTVGIVASLLIETGRFLTLVPLTEFLFGLNWEPQIPMREDQVAAEGAFGWIPVINGTLIITAIAIFISVPIGLMSAIYLNEFAPLAIRRIAKPVLEILAGVPTVVYGFFAVLVIAPAIRGFGASMGVDISPNTALAAGSVMGVMLIPFISSFADDALAAVPRSLRDGSLALGATRAETMLKVLFPAAVPGIAGGVLLAISRAIGETMIVVMAAGLIAHLTLNPLDSVTTVTVQIVTLLIGDTSFDNPKTLAAFALGMMLFLVTLCINVLALRIVHKYREVYS
ncbi:MAG: phosphate ABC transporter permease subunit PstC, partial [Rhodobacteraceae bacterium]|nr:phosphate ABC transporter permease subunit PstC [Paracoccaceae bacterium]